MWGCLFFWDGPQSTHTSFVIDWSIVIDISTKYKSMWKILVELGVIHQTNSKSQNVCYCTTVYTNIHRCLYDVDSYLNLNVDVFEVCGGSFIMDVYFCDSEMLSCHFFFDSNTSLNSQLNIKWSRKVNTVTITGLCWSNQWRDSDMKLLYFYKKDSYSFYLTEK